MEIDDFDEDRTVSSKENERKSLADKVKEFLSQGGEIEEIDSGSRTIKYDKHGLRDDIPKPKWYNTIKSSSD